MTFTLVYWRYLSEHRAFFDSINEAEYYAAVGMEYGELSADRIEDESGNVVRDLKSLDWDWSSVYEHGPNVIDGELVDSTKLLESGGKEMNGVSR